MFRWLARLTYKTYKPAKLDRCGQLKIRSCYFSDLTRLDKREESVFVFEQWRSILVNTL